MPYIYKITNKMNEKVYIGKTLTTIDERWKRHCIDYKKRNSEQRPLYSAMNKYGIDCFTVEMVEECNEDILSEREKYWIEYYSSFKNGYNATIGGDGKPYVDYDLVVATYQHVQNQTKTAKLLGIDIKTVGKILDIRNIDKCPLSKMDEFKKRSFMVNMFSKDGEYIKSFTSAHEAARYISPNKSYNAVDGVAGHILDACKGKRKSAYNYKWSYAKI